VAHYLFQVAYTAEAWAVQIKNPQNRVEIVRPVIEKLGGKIETTYFAFGEYDVILIADFPDNVSAAALSLVATAGGALRTMKTTPLVTIDEGIQAMRKANEVSPAFIPATQQTTARV
jgi:uncharacterized protein with GYD domain